ncbi:Uncharacterised protein [Acinetobacter baumannii]|nr:Uncharacterised protein [Acinetobacter baumannii]
MKNSGTDTRDSEFSTLAMSQLCNPIAAPLVT